MNQIWLIYLLESPVYTNAHPLYFTFNDVVFNWTSTYLSDSTIVAPYGRWQYYDNNIKQLPLKRNYAENKTRKKSSMKLVLGGLSPKEEAKLSMQLIF